jgi:hypothetical protein
MKYTLVSTKCMQNLLISCVTKGRDVTPNKEKKIWAKQDVITGVVTDNRKVQSKSDFLRF